MSGLSKLLAFGPGYFLGKGGELKEFAGSKEGSVLSGRAIWQGGPRDMDMENARTFDVFGSPATAGTNQQTTARAGAAAYGLFAGGAALMGGGGGGSTGVLEGAGDMFGSGTTYNSGASGLGQSGPAASSSMGWRDYARMGSQMQQGGGQQGGGEYVQEDYSAEDQAREYWAGRGQELRAMADAAVRRYLS